MRRPSSYSESFNKLTRREKELLKEVLVTVQEFIENSPKTSNVHYATRDAHAKSYAYLGGNFYPSKTSPFYSLFDQDVYESILRFSHAHLKIIKTDKQLPIYGLAVKIKSKELDEINYPLVNFPVFISNSVLNFLKLFREINHFFTETGGKKLIHLGKLGIYSLPILSEMMNLSFFKAIKKWIQTFSEFILNRTYHSIGVFRLGNYMVKLKMEPIQLDYVANPIENKKENIEDFLILRPIQYELKAEIAYDEKYQPINKLTQEWTNTEEISIGRFEFDRILTPSELDLESISFNPFDNPELFRPVGKIQQLRKEVYDTSIRTRNQINQQKSL